MDIQWIKDRLLKFKEREAVIDGETVGLYDDIIRQCDEWKKYFRVNRISQGEIIAVDGSFNVHYFALLLTLIENNNIVFPLFPGQLDKQKDVLSIGGVDKIIILEKENFRLVHREAERSNPLTRQLREQKQPGLILFSSGSTGEPKGMLHNFKILLQKYREEKKAGRTLLFLLLDHIGGINTVFSILLNGGTLVITGSKQAEHICSLIEKHKIELLPTTPSFLNMLLLSEYHRKYDLSSLKLITYGTEVMQEYILKELNRKLPGVRLRQTYGLSELGILKVKSESSESVWIKMEQDQYRFKIIDNVLHIKSDLAMLGYLNADDPFTEDRWFNTRDKVVVKGDYFKILGRDSELINIGGEKVYPAEIEDIIISMPEVRDVVVKGEKNPILGNMVTARVNIDNCDDLIQLKRKITAFCSGKIKKQFIPARIEIVNEDLFNPRFKKVRK